MTTKERLEQYRAESALLPRSCEREEAKFVVLLWGLPETACFYYLNREDAQKRYDLTVKFDSDVESGSKRWGHVMICEVLDQKSLFADPISTYMAYS